MAENYFNLHLRNKSGSQESSRASNVASFKPEYNKSVLKENRVVDPKLKTNVNYESILNIKF